MVFYNFLNLSSLFDIASHLLTYKLHECDSCLNLNGICFDMPKSTIYVRWIVSVAERI